MSIIGNISELKRAEEALMEAHSSLKLKVKERTADLFETNKKLCEEIAKRQLAEEKLMRQTKFIQLLQDVAISTNEAADMDEAMEICLQKVCVCTGWPIGHVYIKNSNGEMEPTDIWIMKDPDRFKEFIKVTSSTTFATGVGLPGRVLRDGKPHWIIDVTKDKNFPRTQICMEIRLKGAFAFPVVEGKEVVAVLEFFGEKAAEPDPFIIEAITNLATLLGRVTERKSSEELLKSNLIELEKANLGLEEFSYVVSHDLKEPLRTLTNYCELLKRHTNLNLIPEAQKDIEFISGAARRMRKLVNALLDLSHARQAEMSIEEVNLNLIVEKIVSDLDALIKEANGKVLWDNLAVIRGDSNHLTTILQNLIENGLKFHKNGGSCVKISSRKLKTSLEVSVADNGIGIDRKWQKNIFEPFNRLNKTKEYEGSGIGLAICRKIAERHGGEINVESEPGRGSVFSFSISNNL